MKDYPEWVYRVKIPKGLRLVSNEEALDILAAGAEVLGYLICHTDTEKYLKLGIKNYKNKTGGPTLWPLYEGTLRRDHGRLQLLSFVLVDE